MKLRALFLNCTLKKSPEVSNTEAFINVAREMFHELQVTTESIRVVDYQVKFGNTSNEKHGDEWPRILESIKNADILIIATPIWRGDRSSVAKIVAERLDGLWEEANEENGQYPSFNKVAAVMVDGNEDGAKKAISSICFDLSEQGFSLPVSAMAYYVGEAGPGPAYIEAKGDKYLYTNKLLYNMVYNSVHLAKVLKLNPYPTNLNELTEKAKKISEQ